MVSDDVLHLLDDEPAAEGADALRPWTVLIVDDDAAVHESTRFALFNYSLNGRGLRLLSALSAEEGRAILAREPDLAVVLLDVVMESDDAGLRLVDYIRKQLGNETVRIVLRTGQPGEAPERHVVVDYDINDYKSKTELTADKLFTTLTAALRSYEQLRRVTATGRGLSIIVDAASLFFERPSLGRLAEGVLERLTALVEADGTALLAIRDAEQPVQSASVLAARGRYTSCIGKELDELPPGLKDALRTALLRQASELGASPAVIHLRTESGRQIVVLIETDKPLSEIDRNLVALFSDRLSAAFDNIFLQEQLQDANARLEERVSLRTAELYRANQRLAAQRADLRRINRFKSEILGTVAHDLKNPLGVILGRAEILTDLLVEAPLPVEQMLHQLEHVRDCARRLTNMVNDLIVDAMNDALDIAIRREPVDLAILAGEVVAANRPLAERKEQTMTLTGLPTLMLSADQERLREAIENLVGNAIKYSPIGGAIEIAVTRDGSDAVCAVRDEGPGLSPEDLGRLFGRFQRLSAKPTGGEGSTGLGLSIVKRIVELHDGEARADSNGPGLGSVFSIHIPIREACA